MVDKASPVEIRKSKAAARYVASFGLAYVPVPYHTEEQQAAAFALVEKHLDEMEKESRRGR